MDKSSPPVFDRSNWLSYSRGRMNYITRPGRQYAHDATKRPIPLRILQYILRGFWGLGRLLQPPKGNEPGRIQTRTKFRCCSLHLLADILTLLSVTSRGQRGNRCVTPDMTTCFGRECQYLSCFHAEGFCGSLPGWPMECFILRGVDVLNFFAENGQVMTGRKEPWHLDNFSW